MEVISLSSLIEAADNEERERDLNNYLSSFYCTKNNDVESFLHNHAIENEKRSITRTSLVVDESSNYEIVGYFTLMVKYFEFVEDVSRRTKQSLTSNRNATIFNTILIAQLGRSDLYKGIIPGDNILELALHNCKLTHDLVGLRIVCVEYDDVPFLHDFYIKNKFGFLQHNPTGKCMAYIRL